MPQFAGSDLCHSLHLRGVHQPHQIFQHDSAIHRTTENTRLGRARARRAILPRPERRGLPRFLVKDHFQPFQIGHASTSSGGLSNPSFKDHFQVGRILLVNPSTRPKQSKLSRITSSGHQPAPAIRTITPKQSKLSRITSRATSASRRYPGCFVACRERSGRQAFRAVIALRSSVAQNRINSMRWKPTNFLRAVPVISLPPGCWQAPNGCRVHPASPPACAAARTTETTFPPVR